MGWQESLVRNYFVAGLPCSVSAARRQTRRRAKLRVKRPLHNRAGRLLNLCHRHQPPSPVARKYLGSCEQENPFSLSQLAASILAVYSDPTATVGLEEDRS